MRRLADHHLAWRNETAITWTSARGASTSRRDQNRTAQDNALGSNGNSKRNASPERAAQLQRHGDVAAPCENGDSSRAQGRLALSGRALVSLMVPRALPWAF